MINFLPIISFLSGIASVISPCILPVIPILFGLTLKQRKNSELAAFSIGLFLIFTAIIFITAFFTVVFHSYIYYIRIIAGLILAVVGVLFIANKTFDVAIENPKRTEGIIGSFSLGLVTSIAWAPCYSGYLISLLSVLMIQDNVLFNSLNIIIYCIGFAMAILILILILKRMDLARFVKNSVYLRQITGILYLIGSVYMILTAMGYVIL